MSRGTALTRSAEMYRGGLLEGRCVLFARVAHAGASRTEQQGYSRLVACSDGSRRMARTYIVLSQKHWTDLSPQLCRELLRFLYSIDHSGAMLRAALAGGSLSPAPPPTITVALEPPPFRRSASSPSPLATLAISAADVLTPLPTNSEALPAPGRPLARSVSMPGGALAPSVGRVGLAKLRIDAYNNVEAASKLGSPSPIKGSPKKHPGLTRSSSSGSLV